MLSQYREYVNNSKIIFDIYNSELIDEQALAAGVVR
jgi:hypothetical protein